MKIFFFCVSRINKLHALALLDELMDCFGRLGGWDGLHKRHFSPCTLCELVAMLKFCYPTRMRIILGAPYIGRERHTMSAFLLERFAAAWQE